MNYPITPEYLQKAPENLVSIYSALEENILLYLCEQFKTGKLNATAVEMIRTLQRRGINLTEIEKRIKATAKLSDAEFDNVISEAVNFNRQYYNETLDKLGLIGDTYRADALALETQIIAEQTKGLFENITQSLGFAVRGADGKVQFLDIAKTYQRVLDIAEMQVQSGAFGYEEAIRGAVRTLSDSGLQWIEYSTGWHSRVDVAVRRAVMTGITQISAKYSDNLCEEVNTPYIEVTAHRGARDVPGKTPWASHKAWQGKVYSRNAGDIYPSVYAVCGLGEVDGLCGINCRHGYHAWIEGVSERTYTDEELANIDKPPFEFEGKTYSAYEATQKQRQIEASMRTVKRRMEASKAAGLEDDYTDYSIRYRRLDEEYRKFSGAAGLREQRDRALVSSSEKFENSLYNRKKSNIINTRGMANGLRKPPQHILTNEEIKRLKEEAESIEVPTDVLRFNFGSKTGFSDYDHKIHIKGDILPDEYSTIARDRMSSRAVLAHEYYGHLKSYPSMFEIGSWEDEYNASRNAAINTPNLSDKERALLMIDAYDRAKEAGIFLEYDETARSIIYGI